MNAQEVGIVLGLIAARYPNAKLGQDEDMTIQAWAMTLSDVPLEGAKTALANWFKTQKWAPDPSELRSAVASSLLGLPDVEEAWGMVCAARSTYYPGFATKIDLPGPVRQAIEAIGGLHALKHSTTPTADREAFAKAYATYRRRALEDTVIDAPSLPEGQRFRLLG